MYNIKNDSDIKMLRKIYTELIDKDYNASEWSFFHERLLTFAEITGKYSSKTKNQLLISTQMLGTSNKDVGFFNGNFDPSVGLSSAKEIMKEIIDSIQF